MTRRPILALAFAPLALALTTAALAQPADRPPMHGAPHADMGGPEMKARHEARRKQHLEDLKTVLRLRPDQEAALAAFAAAHEPKAFEHKAPDPAATTPQRLEAMTRHEAEMRARHEALRQALAKFYAALSPEQQKVFDALHRLKGSAGHGALMMGGPMMRGPMMVGPGPQAVIRRGLEDAPEPPR